MAFSKAFNLKNLAESAREAGNKFAAQASSVSTQLNANMATAYGRTGRRSTSGGVSDPWSGVAVLTGAWFAAHMDNTRHSSACIVHTLSWRRRMWRKGHLNKVPHLPRLPGHRNSWTSVWACAWQAACRPWT
jgi:hypothetical protein